MNRFEKLLIGSLIAVMIIIILSVVSNDGTTEPNFTGLIALFILLIPQGYCLVSLFSDRWSLNLSSKLILSIPLLIFPIISLPLYYYFRSAYRIKNYHTSKANIDKRVYPNGDTVYNCNVVLKKSRFNFSYVKSKERDFEIILSEFDRLIDKPEFLKEAEKIIKDDKVKTEIISIDLSLAESNESTHHIHFFKSQGYVLIDTHTLIKDMS